MTNESINIYSKEEENRRSRGCTCCICHSSREPATRLPFLAVPLSISPLVPLPCWPLPHFSPCVCPTSSSPVALHHPTALSLFSTCICGVLSQITSPLNPHHVAPTSAPPTILLCSTHTFCQAFLLPLVPRNPVILKVGFVSWISWPSTGAQSEPL